MIRTLPQTWLFISLCISQVLFLCLLPFVLRLIIYVHPLAAGMMWMLVTFGVIFATIVLYAALHRQRIFISYRIFLVLLTLYGACLLILLFFRPSNQVYNEYNLFPMRTIFFYSKEEIELSVAVYNLAGNIGLFVPFGFFLALHYAYYRKEKRHSKYFIPAAAIVTIEVLQYVTHRGLLDIDDFLFNMAGIVIGVWVYRMSKPLFTVR
ncbi:VanZ family protein [Aneurinibacillus sp. REN35]|uniref:VanZ family protein n=1 Tax=Aneurinibacillus sp. REN35 TaxID=3237286 RepID=UPI003527E0CB